MKRIITTLIVLTMTMVMFVGPVYAIQFSDLDSGHWAYEYITTLADSGVINGYTDGTFRPSGTITRGEFLKLTMTPCIPSYVSMEDANSTLSHWAGAYVWLAEQYGVLQQGEYNDENLNEPITRIEMAKLKSKADIIMMKTRQEMAATKFTDVGTCTVEELAMLRHAFNTGLITGYEDGTFKPDKTMTRAEAATMIYRFTK